MDKESRYELQKIDCNCNDCFFMQRDMDKFKESQAKHKKWQEDHFNGQKQRVIDKANDWLEKDEPEKHSYLMREAKKMRFVFDKSTASINFGNCTKFPKFGPQPVSFTPNHVQLDTQDCFEHRIDHLDEETRNKRLGL
jgi:hypothetical protein